MNKMNEVPNPFAGVELNLTTKTAATRKSSKKSHVAPTQKETTPMNNDFMSDPRVLAAIQAAASQAVELYKTTQPVVVASTAPADTRGGFTRFVSAIGNSTKAVAKTLDTVTEKSMDKVIEKTQKWEDETLQVIKVRQALALIASAEKISKRTGLDYMALAVAKSSK